MKLYEIEYVEYHTDYEVAEFHRLWADDLDDAIAQAESYLYWLEDEGYEVELLDVYEVF